MRITKKTILAIGLIANSLTLNSCDDNDNNEVSQRPTALVTVYPSAPDGFFIACTYQYESLTVWRQESEGFGELYNRKTKLRRQPTECVCKLD